MKKILIISLSLVTCHLSLFAAGEDKFISCGPGFILVETGKVDGMDRAECQKLWCRDLENGKSMGAGDKATAGYKATNMPIELCDATNKCVECFGDRNWCKGETTGVWNPEFGAYTKKGDDSNAFLAIQRGDCFAWSIQKPKCEGADEVAMLINDKWVCAVSGGMTENARQSSVRRTGTIRLR
ncbi:MAG: hypothetical protein FWG18_02445 [Alphaproteobacteria bacterium]|nr:hypothetical protein [Alphaproteobacteria bacterium]